MATQLPGHLHDLQKLPRRSPQAVDRVLKQVLKAESHILVVLSQWVLDAQTAHGLMPHVLRIFGFILELLLAHNTAAQNQRIMAV